MPRSFCIAYARGARALAAVPDPGQPRRACQRSVGPGSGPVCVPRNIGWQDPLLAVPLVQLAGIAVDEGTEQALQVWHTWMERGYVF